MLKGYLTGVKGVQVSERRLRLLMPANAPQAHHSRQQNSQEQTNPAMYTARYYGHKLHLDQNEKLIHYCVTYVFLQEMVIQVGGGGGG